MDTQSGGPRCRAVSLTASSTPAPWYLVRFNWQPQHKTKEKCVLLTLAKPPNLAKFESWYVFLCFFLRLRAATIEFIAQTEALQQYQTVHILWYCRTILLSYNKMSHIMHCHSIQSVSLKKHVYKDFTKLQVDTIQPFLADPCAVPFPLCPRRPRALVAVKGSCLLW